MRWTGAYVVAVWPGPGAMARSGSEAWRSISAVGGVGGSRGSRRAPAHGLVVGSAGLPRSRFDSPAREKRREESGGGAKLARIGPEATAPRAGRALGLSLGARRHDTRLDDALHEREAARDA